MFEHINFLSEEELPPFSSTEKLKGQEPEQERFERLRKYTFMMTSPQSRSSSTSSTTSSTPSTSSSISSVSSSSTTTSKQTTTTSKVSDSQTRPSYNFNTPTYDYRLLPYHDQDPLTRDYPAPDQPLNIEECLKRKPLKWTFGGMLSESLKKDQNGGGRGMGVERERERMERKMDFERVKKELKASNGLV